jgi:poly-beta-1,6-N-acetyl-D-glucosamine synthase
MAGSKSLPRYIVISPVKDEERYVELTLESVTKQTVLPAVWVIVNDGSRDRTSEIIHGYADRFSFIRVIDSKNSGSRQPGAAVIHAFEKGYESIRSEDYDIIVKLDCDLSFEPDYFERLLAHFQDDPQLGIASGVYLDITTANTWRMVSMPVYHAFGACKVIRRACFEQIGRFVTARGWDTVDEIRALTRGWTTRHFTDLVVKHHKPEGSGIGFLRTSKMHGEIYYATGGDPLFMAGKVLRRMAKAPFIINGLALTYGYLSAVVNRKPRLVTSAEATYYRRLLRKRLFGATPAAGSLATATSRR